MRGDLIDDWVKLSTEERQNAGNVCSDCGTGEPIYKDQPPYKRSENKERYLCVKCHKKFKRRVYYENSCRNSEIGSWGKGTSYNQ